jgi:hypothetical protein
VVLHCEQACCDALQLEMGDRAPLWLAESDVDVARARLETVITLCMGDFDFDVRIQIG